MCILAVISNLFLKPRRVFYELFLLSLAIKILAQDRFVIWVGLCISRIVTILLQINSPDKIDFHQTNFW